MIKVTLTRAVGATLLPLLLAGCGGRVAQPVLVDQPYDSRLSCAHLAGELSNNEKRLAELKAERDLKPAENLGMLVTSPLFLDLSPSQKREVEALLARNARLGTMMAEKGCETAAGARPEVRSPSGD